MTYFMTPITPPHVVSRAPLRRLVLHFLRMARRLRAVATLTPMVNTLRRCQHGGALPQAGQYYIQIDNAYGGSLHALSAACILEALFCVAQGLWREHSKSGVRQTTDDSGEQTAPAPLRRPSSLDANQAPQRFMDVRTPRHGRSDIICGTGLIIACNTLFPHYFSAPCTALVDAETRLRRCGSIIDTTRVRAAHCTQRCVRVFYHSKLPRFSRPSST